MRLIERPPIRLLGAACAALMVTGSFLFWGSQGNDSLEAEAAPRRLAEGRETAEPEKEDGLAALSVDPDRVVVSSQISSHANGALGGSVDLPRAASQLGTAAGTVILPKDFPASAMVEVRAKLSNGSFTTPVRTGSDGTWRLDDLTPGTSVFQARAVLDSRMAMGSYLCRPETVQGGAVGLVILTAEYFVEVGCLSDIFRPLEKLRADLSYEPAGEVEAWFAERTWLAESMTDDRGYLRVALPGPGTLTVAAPAIDPFENAKSLPRFVPNVVELEVSRKEPHARGELILMRASGLQGQLQTSGVRGEEISVFARDLGRYKTYRASTSGTGAFLFEPLPTGSYRFYARHGGDSGQEYCMTRTLELRPGELNRVDSRLRPSSQITGTVVDTRGQPLAGVTVRAVGVDNSNLKRVGSSDELGLFTVSGLYGCEYLITVDGHTRNDPFPVSVPPNGGTVDVGTWAEEQSPLSSTVDIVFPMTPVPDQRR